MLDLDGIHDDNDDEEQALGSDGGHKWPPSVTPFLAYTGGRGGFAGWMSSRGETKGGMQGNMGKKGRCKKINVNKI